MPKYRLKEKMKHRRGSVLYRAGDIIEMEEADAKKIMSKLDLLGAPTPEEFASEPNPLPPEEETEDETEEETEDEPGKEDEGSSDSDETHPSEGSEEDAHSESSSPLSLGHAGQGLFNVLKDGEKINDVPLSEEEARAMIEGSQ